MADSRRPSDLADKMLIRLPPGMRERIAEVAKANGRSANAEVVACLEKALDDDGAIEAIAAELTEHEDRIKDLERDVYRLLDAAGMIVDYK